MAEKRSSADLLQGGPPAAPPQMDTGPRPIGVPETTRDPETGQEVPFGAERSYVQEGFYGAALKFGNQNITIPPRYWTGDEWRPGSWDAGRVSELQIGLAKAGLLEGKFTLGFWDEASKNAYSQILGSANAMGTTWEQALQLAVEAPIPREPLQIRLTAPEDLRRVFKAAAFEVSATAFTPAQIDAMVAAYHEKERAFQEAMASGETEVTVPLDPTSEAGFGAFVEEQASAQNPEGVLERKTQMAEETWINAIGDTLGAAGG